MQTPITGNQPAELRQDKSLPQEAYALLAQANLLRIRGQWPEAIEKCILAMKLSPQNPAAQSLLGDIYENQGSIDDAIQWYRMALDTKPDSIADEKKLQRLLREKKTVEHTASGAKSARVIAVEEPADEITIQPRIVRDPANALRLTAFISCVLVIAIVIFAVYTKTIVHHSSQTTGIVHTPPVFLNKNFPANPLDADSPAVALSRDPQDQAFFETLKSSPAMSLPDTALTDVQSDPRTGRVTLTILVTLNATAIVSRETVLRYALPVAQAASRTANASTSYSMFTIRVMLSRIGDPTGGTPLVFTGDATRTDLAGLPGDTSALSLTQIQTAFTNPWWSATVGQ